MGRRGDLRPNRILREVAIILPSNAGANEAAGSEVAEKDPLRRNGARWKVPAGVSFSKPTENRLHAVRTAGGDSDRCSRDVAELAPSAKLLRRVNARGEQTRCRPDATQSGGFSTAVPTPANGTSPNRSWPS